MASRDKYIPQKGITTDASDHGKEIQNLGDLNLRYIEGDEVSPGKVILSLKKGVNAPLMKMAELKVGEDIEFVIDGRVRIRMEHIND